MRGLRLAIVVATLAGFLEASADAAFQLQNEESEVAFCKSLPRPKEAASEINIDDYCECWVGSTENEWTRAEYDQWKGRSSARRR
jgi:hypothetical protein